MLRSLLSSPAILALALSALPAQELIAVNFQGQAFGIDFATGASRSIGSTGVSGCNAMAFHDGVLYSTAQTGATGPRHLVTIDPITARATIRFSNIGIDLRALAGNAGSDELFGIVEGNPDRLVRIHVVTGQITNVGNTGLTGLQGLDENDASPFLLGWDINVGLVHIDKATGVATDPAPGLGTQGADIQFLTSVTGINDLPLVGGRTSLYSVNRLTGVVTRIGTSTTLPDLRGAETHRGIGTEFGLGCLTARGTAATLGAKSSFLAGIPISMFSTSHAPSAPAILMLGASTTTFQGLALPFDVDPLLGTIGCRVFVGPDITIPAVANTAGLVSIPVTIPLRGATVHFQCATLEPVTGGASFTHGLSVTTPR